MKLPRIVTEEGRAAKVLNIVMVMILCALFVGHGLFSDVPSLVVDDEAFLEFAGEASTLLFAYIIAASFTSYRLAKFVKLAAALTLIWMIVFAGVVLARFVYLTGAFEGLHWSYPLFLVLAIINFIRLLRAHNGNSEDAGVKP